MGYGIPSRWQHMLLPLHASAYAHYSAVCTYIQSMHALARLGSIHNTYGTAINHFLLRMPCVGHDCIDAWHATRRTGQERQYTSVVKNVLA